jgi:hypothetical protein
MDTLDPADQPLPAIRSRALSFRGSPQGAWSQWTLNRRCGFVQTGPGVKPARRASAQAVDGELVRVLGVDALAFVQLEALGREHDRLLLPAHQEHLDALQRGVVEGGPGT